MDVRREIIDVKHFFTFCCHQRGAPRSLKRGFDAANPVNHAIDTSCIASYVVAVNNSTLNESVVTTAWDNLRLRTEKAFLQM
jgi:hypothetical protein